MKNPFRKDDLSKELLEFKSHRHQEDFERDYTDKDLPTYSTEPEATPVADLKKPAPASRFNWASFWTMLVSILVVVILVIFVPGPFDEIAAAIALSAINAFIANYRK